ALGGLRRWSRRLFLGRRWRWFRILARLRLAIGTTRSRRCRRFLRPLAAHPRLAFARRRILPLPTLLPHRRVALPFGVDELLARVAMVAARPPIAAPRVPAFVGIARRFRRFPQLSAREVFHLRVGMFLFDALERRQQFLAGRSSERSRKSARNNRPVRVTRRHGASLSLRRAA